MWLKWFARPTSVRRKWYTDYRETNFKCFSHLSTHFRFERTWLLQPDLKNNEVMLFVMASTFYTFKCKSTHFFINNFAKVNAIGLIYRLIGTPQTLHKFDHAWYLLIRRHKHVWLRVSSWSARSAQTIYNQSLEEAEFIYGFAKSKSCISIWKVPSMIIFTIIISQVKHNK